MPGQHPIAVIITQQGTPRHGPGLGASSPPACAVRARRPRHSVLQLHHETRGTLSAVWPALPGHASTEEGCTRTGQVPTTTTLYADTSLEIEQL